MRTESDRLGVLTDHHCHGLVTTDLDREGFEALMNEAPHASPLGTSLFDSMLGLAIRRHCAPVLGRPAVWRAGETVTGATLLVLAGLVLRA